MVGDEPVWCVTTRNGSWVARQGNTITITGNCNYGGAAETIWKLLVGKGMTVPLGLVRGVLQKWFETHPQIKAWQDDLVETAAKNGYVEAPLSGRREHFHGGFGTDSRDRNRTLNYPIQATAGDLMNRAILALDEQIRWDKGEAIVGQIHDEILVEGPDPVRLGKLLKSTMEQTITLNNNTMKFPVDVEVGKDWLNMETLAC